MNKTFTGLSLTLGLVLASTAIPAEAQGLLYGSIANEDSQLNDDTIVYEQWHLYDANGKEYIPANRPFSWFSKVQENPSVPTTNQIPMPQGLTNHNGIDVPSNNKYLDIFANGDDGFDIGDYVTLLDYRGLEEGSFYAYPISVPIEDDYILTGYAKGMSSVYPKSYPDHVLSKWNALLMVPMKTLEKVDITYGKQEDGKYAFKVIDTKGNELDYAFATTPYKKSERAKEEVNGEQVPVKLKQFNHTFHLTPDYKYLAFYAPHKLMMFDKLNLDTKEGIYTNAIEIESEKAIEEGAKTIYYDLNGIELKQAPTFPGIYIKITNGRREKVCLQRGL